jgi:hypothetical protein
MKLDLARLKARNTLSASRLREENMNKRITFGIVGPGTNPQIYNMLWLKQP